VNLRSLLILVAGAAVLGFLVLLASGPGGGDDAGERLLPGLDEALNDVRRIVVTAGGDRTVATLEHSGQGWRVAERDGYPADIGRIRRNLLALAEARIVERKTANPEFHGRLGVADLSDPEATGSRFDIEAGDYRASVIIGDTGVSGGRMAYVRRVGEDQSYMVAADLQPSVNRADWLDEQIVDIPSTRIRRVTIRHPDGAVLQIARASAEATDFTVRDLPEDRELTFPAAANPVGAALAALELDDVTRAEDFDPGSTEPVVGRFETFDGLVVEATSWELEDGTRVRFEARAEPADSASADAGQTTPATTGVDGEPADVAQEASRLASRFEGWVYTLPSFKAEQLTRRLDDLLAPAD